MTNITIANDRYELIPGVSAYRLSRIMRLVVGASTVIFSVLAFLVATRISGTSRLTGQGIAELLSVCGIPFLIIVCFSVALGFRSRAEKGAGYTTMTSGHSDLDQVDPGTGVVIRRAGSAVLTTPLRGADQPGPTLAAVLNASSLDTVRFEAPRVTRTRQLRVWGLVIFFIVMLAVMFGFPLVGLSGRPDALAMSLMVALLTLAGAGALVTVILLSSSALVRSKESAAASARPGALAFTTQRTPELVNALRAIGIARPRLRLQFAVTLGVEGIELWSGRRTGLPRVTLPWSDINHVHPGRLMVSNGKRSFPVLTLHVFQDVGGRALDLPLPIYGRRGIMYANTDRGNEVLSAVARYTKII